MTITEQKDHLDFAKIGDTGQDNIDAIGPITDGQPATQSTFRRPSENLRERTEDIRQAVEDSFYARDTQQLAISTIGDITWEGTVLNGGTGKILQSEAIIIKPFLTPRVDTKASISIGVPLPSPTANQITYTVSAAGFATQGMNRVFIEHRDGGVATVLGVTISDGPVKRILVLFDAANILHDAATTKGLVDAAIAADPELSGKITTTINAVPVQTIAIQAETRFEGTAEAEEHVLAAGVLDTFTTANPLAAGDTVAIWYRYLVDPVGGFDGRRESTSSHGTNAVPAASLFITSLEPSKIPGAIPICTVLPGLVSGLLFIDGTLFGKDETHALGTVSAALVPYNGGPAWADATTNPPDTVEAQLDKIISDLGQGVAGTAKISSDALVASAPGNDAVGAAALFAQLQTLLDLINDRADLTDLTTQIFKGLLTLEKTVTFKQGDVPLGATPRISMEEATVPTNLLILQSKVLTAPDRYMRVYSGSAVGTVFQITFNAQWDGTGLWLRDAAGTPATRFVLSDQGAQVNRILAPAASWAEAAWNVADGSFTTGYLSALVKVTAPFVEANGAGGLEATTGNITADLGDIVATGGNVAAAGYVSAGTEFQFAASRDDIFIVIPPIAFRPTFGAPVYTATDTLPGAVEPQWFGSGGADLLFAPLRLPANSELVQVRFLIKPSTTISMVLSIYATDTEFSAGLGFTPTEIALHTTSPSANRQRVILSGGNYAVNGQQTHFELGVGMTSAADNFYGVRVQIRITGPTLD